MTEEQEIAIVKDIGEQIGYGNLMWIASALWAEELKNKGLPTEGAFRPTLRCLMNQDGKEMSDVDLISYNKKVRDFNEGNF